LDGSLAQVKHGNGFRSRQTQYKTKHCYAARISSSQPR
jgi:hypothetical protein